MLMYVGCSARTLVCMCVSSHSEGVVLENMVPSRFEGLFITKATPLVFKHKHPSSLFFSRHLDLKPILWPQ